MGELEDSFALAYARAFASFEPAEAGESEATVNWDKVLKAAAVRSILYVILSGIGVYITAVQAGDSQSHAIYKGIGAAVAMGLVRLGGEGGYDAKRASSNAVQPSDVGAFSNPLHS